MKYPVSLSGMNIICYLNALEIKITQTQRFCSFDYMHALFECLLWDRYGAAIEFCSF